MLLDYAATYSNAIIHYKARDMVLDLDSNGAYLTMPEARSYYAGHFYLSYWTSPSPIKHNPKRNGPIQTECKIIRNVLFSVAEYETCGTFNNGKTYIGMRPDLISLDHKQPATPLKTENSATEAFVNLGMKPSVQKHGI